MALPARLELLARLAAECDHGRAGLERARLARHGRIRDGDDERSFGANGFAVELELGGACDDEVQLLLPTPCLVMASQKLIACGRRDVDIGAEGRQTEVVLKREPLRIARCFLLDRRHFAERLCRPPRH